jgi:hypothetical protein
METTSDCPECKAAFTRKSKKGIQKFCSPDCRYKNWARNNREQLNAAVRRYRARRYAKEGQWRDSGAKAIALKEWMIELKSEPCTDCGNQFPVCCMDFDHRAGTKKAYNLGSMFAHHYSRELIQTELDKCDLVCSNCHRIRTQNRRKGSGTAHLKHI